MPARSQAPNHVIAPVTEAELLSIAKAFARRRLVRGRKITQPARAFEYLQILLQDVEHEVFSAVFLDSQHRVIRFEELFRGTIDAASVYPREVVKCALAHNAARSFWSTITLVETQSPALPTGELPTA